MYMKQFSLTLSSCEEASSLPAYLVFLHVLNVLLVLGELGGDGLILHDVITVGALPDGVIVQGVEGQQRAVLALGAVHARHHRPQLSPVLKQKNVY